MNFRNTLAAIAVFLALASFASCKKEVPAGKEHIPASPVPPLPAEPAEPVGTDSPGGPMLPGAVPPAASFYSCDGGAYDCLADLEDAEDRAGFILLGSFGGMWPCKVSSTETARNEMKFELQDAGPQAYTGYAGYQLKLVRLICRDDREAGVVFRSKEKKK